MKNLLSVVGAVSVALAAHTAVAGINGGGSAKAVSADEPSLIVTGPVETYDAKHHSARVLGQTVALQHGVEVVVGDVVSVVGIAGTDGVIAATAVKDQGIYIPGSSAIFLSGRVQKLNKAVGAVTVNGLTVDFTALMATDIVAPAVGSKIQISGTQPSLGGVVLANGINGGGVAAAGINGGGMAAAGINGGGSKAVSAGINGGGMAAAGINGGGSKAVAAGINGGGMAAAGINGGGSKAVAAGINGGGMAAAGINGGGSKVVAAGINGGGMAAAGINGGGKTLAGINGGGK